MDYSRNILEELVGVPGYSYGSYIKLGFTLDEAVKVTTAINRIAIEHGFGKIAIHDFDRHNEARSGVITINLVKIFFSKTETDISPEQLVDEIIVAAKIATGKFTNSYLSTKALREATSVNRQPRYHAEQNSAPSNVVVPTTSFTAAFNANRLKTHTSSNAPAIAA